MLGGRKAPKRFSLLLLEEGEDYVDDWVASVAWPSAVSGNWQSLPKLPGRLRLCSKSIFFEPDDVRIPVVRWGVVRSLHVSRIHVGRLYMLSKIWLDSNMSQSLPPLVQAANGAGAAHGA